MSDAVWVEQERGAWLGVASERAVEYAEGDNDRLAAVGLAAFLSAYRVSFAWTIDQPLVVTVKDWLIGVRADTGTDPDTFTITPAVEPWTFCSRILPGPTTLILHVGLAQAFDPEPAPLPQRAFLSMSEWLRCFPPFYGKGSTA